MAYVDIDLQYPCKRCGEVRYFMGFKTMRILGTKTNMFMCKHCASEILMQCFAELGDLNARLARGESIKGEVVQKEVVQEKKKGIEVYTDENGDTWLEE